MAERISYGPIRAPAVRAKRFAAIAAIIEAGGTAAKTGLVLSNAAVVSERPDHLRLADYSGLGDTASHAVPSQPEMQADAYV